MKPAIGSLSVQKMFRYVEWILIVGVAFDYFLLAANDIISLTAAQLWQLSTFFITMVALSWNLPVHRSSWLKYAYISLEISLVLTVQYFSGLNVGFFILVTVAKSCFLFRRKRVMMLTAVVGILFVVVIIGSLPKSIETFPYATTDIDPREPKLIKELVISSISTYVVFSSFMIIFCSTMLAEQRSRQRAEQLTQQVEGLAAQLERVRIARDIHDSLGHTLTNLQVQLALAQEFRQHKPERTFRAIDLAKFLADQCVEDVSLKLQAMHQADFHLAQALESLLEQLRHYQGVRVNAEINLPPLPLQVSHNLYYTIKEGLTNIQKHSNASRIYLECQVKSDRLTVSLEDNGIGFDPAQSYAGYGIQGMKERIQLLSGQLRICSALGAGTQIEMVIPLKPELNHSIIN